MTSESLRGRSLKSPAVSRANVELVRSLQPGPDVDLAQVFRDEEVAGAVLRTLGHVYHDDFECVFHALGSRSYGGGIDGLRQGWLDWLEPWETYHVEIEELFDLGDDVLIHVTDSGRRRDTDASVSLRGASIWTVRDGKVARAQFFAEREEARRAANLD